MNYYEKVERRSQERILCALALGKKTLNEIAENSGLTRETTSKHLKIMALKGVLETWNYGNVSVFELKRKSSAGAKEQ